MFSHSIYRANKAHVTQYFERSAGNPAYTMKAPETGIERIKPTNKVTLRGTILGIRSSATVTSFVLISDGGEEKGSTVSNIVFYGNLKESFKVRDHVDVVAHMQSKIIKGAEGKNEYHQMVIGDKIRKSNRMLADYLPFPELQTPNGGIPDDINKAFVYGKVSRVYAPTDGYAIVTVAVPSKEGKMNYVDLICYKRQAQVAHLLHEGDCIVSIGELRSAKERPKQNEIFWQSIICKDIAKFDELDMDTSLYSK